MGSQPGQPRDDTSAGLETAVVVVVDVPQLETIFRKPGHPLSDRATIWSPYRLGIPPHVTLLFPFVAPGELESALPLLRAAVVGQEPFTFELGELRTFPGAIWLAPEPAAPFVALSEAIQAAFPEYPPYSGAFEDVIPHLTLAEGVEVHELEATLALLRALVEPMLPVKVAADQATVLAEQPGGDWMAWGRLPLGV